MSLLSNIKLKLGITDTSQDALLTLLLEEAQSAIHRILDVAGFEEGEYSEVVKWNNKGTYTLRNYPVSEILEVNGEGSFGDALIVYDRKVLFSDIPKATDFGFVTIKYKAGYEELPGAIKSIYTMTAIGMYNKRNNVGIRQYRLGEESITFASEEDYDMYDSILSAYRKMDVIG